MVDEKFLKRNSAIPLYLQLARFLRKEIQAGKIPSLSSLPPERDLAKIYGVDRRTVRNALSILQKEGLIERVQGKGTFVRERTNRLRGKTIGMIIYDLEFSEYPGISTRIEGIREVLELEGFFLQLIGIREPLERGEVIPFLEEIAQSGQYAGIILSAQEISWEGMEVFHRYEIPLVVILYYEKDIPANVIMEDRREGIKRATEYLIYLGHRKIGLLHGPSDLPGEIQMEEGYRKAFSEHGLSFSPSWLKGSYLEEEIVEKMTRDLLEEGVTAVIASADIRGLMVIKTARNRGLNIPEDLSLIVSGESEFSAHLIPPLTTISFPLRRIGREAARILLDSLKGRKNWVKVKVTPRMIIRESCAFKSNSEIDLSLLASFEETQWVEREMVPGKVSLNSRRKEVR